LVTLTEEEIAILNEYLPRQLTEEELEEVVIEAIKKTGAQSKKDIGKLMAEIMPRVKGKAEGKHVNEIIMRHLK